MARPHCVRCGCIVQNALPAYEFDRWCAPCCEDCEPAVSTETMKDYSMWPHDYIGGWLWNGFMWVETRPGQRPGLRSEE